MAVALGRNCRACYSAVLSVFHVSACRRDLLCVISLPKSAAELSCCQVCTPSRGGRCVCSLVLKHSLVFAEITVLYTH